MQLGTWTIPLLPAVAVGVAVVLAVLVGWGVSRARRRSAATVPPVGETVGEDTHPCPEDWTGEAAGGAADPLPPRRTTVADAVAARGADTPAYGAMFPAGQWPAERPYAAPERHHPGGDTTVRTGAVATGVTAPGASEHATGSSTDTTALPTVEAVAATTSVSGADASAPSAPETTALPLVRTADATAPPATHPAEPGTAAAGSSAAAQSAAAPATAGPTAAGPTAAGPTTAAPITAAPTEAGPEGAGTARAGATAVGLAAGTTAAGLAAAGSTGTGSAEGGPAATGGAPTPTGTDTVADGTRPRTGPRHAYTPAPTPPAPARTAYDPWAVEPEPGPDPWAAPPAPDPTVALAAPDATAQLAAHEPTGREPDRAAGTRPADTDPTGAPTIAGEPALSVPTASLPDTRDVAAPTGPDGVAPAADVGARPVESGDSALPVRSDVVETVEDVEGLDPEHPDDAVDSGPVPPPWSAARSDPDVAHPDAVAAPISVAVAQALAAREVHRSRGSLEDGTDPDLDQVPAADARDRLLSVLLADPAAALGAATDLDDTRARIDRLGDVLRRRRTDLATAVRRLHASGLTEPQIGRLAGLGDDDVRAILEHRTEEDPAGR